MGSPLGATDRAGGACGSFGTRAKSLQSRHDRLGLGGRIERALSAAEIRHAALWSGENLEHCADILEGLALRAYRYEQFRATATPPPKRIDILVPKGRKAEAKAIFDAAWSRAASTNFGRSLADLPPNYGTPEKFVERAREGLEGTSLRIEVLGLSEIEAAGMGLFCAVARGAQHEAKLLRIEHRADEAEELPTLALIGKGVTMDAGGYNLKTGGAVHEMSYDKAGAAAVVGAMKGIAEADLPVHVIALCPLVENLVGSAAVRPGEVVEAYDGTQVYIENTDAEGRLLMADLLAWLGELEPDMCIDIATLTGACHTALGDPYSGLFSNDDEARDILVAAGERSDDLVWPLPIHDYHDRELAHLHADLRNVGAYAGAASAAAAFLRYFVSYPWAHIDMGGKAYFPYERDYVGAGATGYGCRLLLEAAHGFADSYDFHEDEGDAESEA